MGHFINSTSMDRLLRGCRRHFIDSTSFCLVATIIQVAVDIAVFDTLPGSVLRFSASELASAENQYAVAATRASPKGMPMPRPILAPVLRPDAVEVEDALAVAEEAWLDAPVGIEVGKGVAVLESELEVEVVHELELVVDVEVATIPIVVNAFKSPVNVVVFTQVTAIAANLVAYATPN
jgi:hypothetical protein